MKKILLLALVLPVAIGACSNVKKTLGMERNQPDEFTVVERAPLTVPPNFDLLPPRPGAPAMQDTNNKATAEGLILGTQTGNTVTVDSAAENDVLSQAGSAARKPVPQVKDDSADQESVADKLGLSDPQQGTALDPSEEAARLNQQNIKTPISPVMKNAQ